MGDLGTANLYWRALGRSVGNEGCLATQELWLNGHHFPILEGGSCGWAVGGYWGSRNGGCFSVLDSEGCLSIGDSERE